MGACLPQPTAPRHHRHRPTPDGNGDAFLEHDRSTGTEREIPLDQFPSPDELWQRYREANDITPEIEPIVTQPYHSDGGGKEPRYYQRIAINRTIDAIARGKNRALVAKPGERRWLQRLDTRRSVCRRIECGTAPPTLQGGGTTYEREWTGIKTSDGARD